MLKPLVVACLLVLLVFLPSLQTPFIHFDDPNNITANPWLTGPVLRFWTETFYGGYIPLMFTVWSWLHGLDWGPVPFHVFNVLLHMANTVLVVLLLARLFPKAAPLPLTLGGLLFGLHALQIEPVYWVTGGRDVFSAFFILAALNLLLAPRGGWASAAGATVFFAAAVLSKTTAVAVPAAAIALAIGFKDLRSTLRLATLGGWLVISAGAVWMLLATQSDFVSNRLAPLTFWERATVAVDSLGFYLRRMVWPWPLTIDHGRTPAVALEGAWFGSAALLMVLTVVAVVFRRRIPATVWAALAFIVILLSPVLGFIPNSAQVFTTVADRYTYLPLIGFAILALEAARRSPSAARLLFVLVPVYALTAIWYGMAWRSNERLFHHALKHEPGSYVALTALAVDAMAKRDYATAEGFLNQAWKARPRLAMAPANLGAIYWATGRGGEMLERIEPFVRDLDNVRFNRHETASLSLLYVNLGRAQMAAKNWDQALIYYCNYGVLEPGQPGPQSEIRQFLSAMKTATGRGSCDR